MTITNLESVLKSRDITLQAKVHIAKAMLFPVVMYECVSWTIKKAEGRRIDAFKLWCQKRLLRVPWNARRSNQSILKEINSEHSDAEAPILQPPDAKSRLTGKDLDAGKDRGLAKYGVAEDEMARWHHRHNGHGFEQTPGDSGGQRSLACHSRWGRKESDMTQQLLITTNNSVQ